MRSLILYVCLSVTWAIADQQWNTHKVACEARIQELFNQIEPQWIRMSVDQEFMDAFFDINRGSGESAIIAVGSPGGREAREILMNSTRPSLSV